MASTSRETHPTRRGFLAAAAAAPLAMTGVEAAAAVVPGLPARIKTSCNLFSFNEPLTKGSMTLEQVLEFCAEIGFDGVDPTGYYFTGYPAVPTDARLHRIKQLAFSLGLGISGTGVRNDFAVADAARRDADVALITRWVGAAARLGAPVLRVFDGKVMPDGVAEGHGDGLDRRRPAAQRRRR